MKHSYLMLLINYSFSPAGSIARNSSAARYLGDRGLLPKDFNSYGSRRGNDGKMIDKILKLYFKNNFIRCHESRNFCKY